MERILLVDDDAVSRTVLSTQLEQSGYSVDEADDGHSALEMLYANPDYAAVVTDRLMPNMDGLELLQRMQADARLRLVPVIMLTGANTPQEVGEGIGAGVYYYLVKPFQTDALLTLIRSSIAERQKTEILEARFSTQTKAMMTLTSGRFEIRTPDEALDLAFLLGCLFPRPELAVGGLYELMLNAIEHGNLGIGFAQKARLLAEGGWEAALRDRLALPQNAGKRVDVQFAQNGERIEVLIADMGPGFDWRPFLEIEPSRATQANGRGIAKANLLGFDQLSYLGTGNRVHIINRREAA